MTKPKKFRVGQVVFSKLDQEYVRLLRSSSDGRIWWATARAADYGSLFTVLEVEIRPLTKRESAK